MSPGSAGTSPQFRVIDISLISRLFRWVNYANYFMLLVGGNAVLAAALQVWTVRSMADAIGFALALAVYGFSAWVGWRNIGILHAVIDKFSGTALLILSIFSTLIFLVFLPKILASSEARYSEIAAATVGLMTAVVSLAGLFALMILHRLSVPVMHVKLRQFLARSLSQRPAHRTHLKPLNRNKGIAYFAGGLLWLAGIDWLPEDAIPRAVAQQLWQVSQLGFVALIYARHYLRPDFQTVVASDLRPPVVFLRSFQDDEQLNYQRAESALFDFSLESRLAEHYSAIGPFIAVGKPGDELPHLGAARASLSDSEWQGTVTDWMARATLLIVMIGRTHWIDWELRRIIELGHTDKLIIVFPQVRRPRFSWFSWAQERRSDAEERLTVIRTAFSGTQWESGLYPPVEEPQNLRSLAFLPKGEVVIVTSSPRNRESYHLAALLAEDAQTRARTGVIPDRPARLAPPKRELPARGGPTSS